MNLTEEQKQVIDSTGNIKINAVAGSGKTTTLVEYVKARQQPDKKFLYLAFNASVKKHVSAKFNSLGIQNVRVETAHSLAYKHIVRKRSYQIAQNYRLNDLVSILDIRHRDSMLTFLVAGHIKKFAAYYCNTSAEKVQDLEYLSTIADPMARAFAEQYYEQIEYGTRIFLTKMLRGEIPVTHDFYLKMFQLSNPALKYDYILFDEGQDASPCMLDVFLRQNGNKIIVGDTNQQIYSWRYAVNSLETVKGFTELSLTQSFRLDSELAELSQNILGWKNLLDSSSFNLRIRGISGRTGIKTRATIARTNLRLLTKAIELSTGYSGIGKIYFEGNIASYTYAGEGASLYDVLNLQQGNYHLIKDDLIREMKGIPELKEYADRSEENELNMLIDIVEEYGTELPSHIRRLKEKHVQDCDREDADMVFSTVHRCKGMEYDEVTIEKDFVSEDVIIRQSKSGKPDKIALDALNEEINLLYVAVTRARCKLKIPEELTDADSRELILNSGRHILISSDKEKHAPVYSRKIVRGKQSGGEIWSSELDSQLEQRLQKKTPLKFIAKQMNIPRKEVIRRIRELELFDRYDIYY